MTVTSPSRRAACLLLAAVTGGCAHASRPGTPPGTVPVEAEGWTPLDPRRPLEARRRALAEAQKDAVERATGVSVTARTSVSAAVAHEQRITAAMSGRILRYRVLSERAEDGFLKVRIRALVLREPRPPDGWKVAVSADDEAVGRAVAAAFAAEGFAVGGRPEDADFVVSAEASSYPLDGRQPAGLRVSRSRVSLDAVSKAGARLSRTQEAAALDAVAEIARGKAAALAGRLAGEKLAATLKSSLADAARAGGGLR